MDTDTPDTRAPLVRFATALGLIAVLLAVVWGVAHVSLTPVNPKQEAPKRHVTWQCSLCHAVSEDAKLIRIEE